MSIKREKELARAKFERQQNRRKSRQSRSRFLKLILLVSAIGAVGYYFTDQLGSDSALPTPITSTAPIFATAPQIAGCTEAMTPRANNISFRNLPGLLYLRRAKQSDNQSYRYRKSCSI